MRNMALRARRMCTMRKSQLCVHITLSRLLPMRLPRMRNIRQYHQLVLSIQKSLLLLTGISPRRQLRVSTTKHRRLLMHSTQQFQLHMRITPLDRLHMRNMPRRRRRMRITRHRPPAFRLTTTVNHPTAGSIVNIVTAWSWQGRTIMLSSSSSTVSCQ
jgi:hypothetical protein